MKIILNIVVLAALLTGCAGTAHRNISEGTMRDNNGWEIRQGGGRSGSPYQATVFLGEKLRITVLPCNYDDGFSTLILPFPIPLGSQPGIVKGDQFLIGISIASYLSGEIEPSGNIGLYPGRTKLLINGIEYLPAKISEKGSTCDLDKVHIGFKVTSRDWGKVDSSYLIKGEKYTHFTLWYDLPTPSTDTDFTLIFEQLRGNDEIIQIPTMFFSKGDSWGGW